MNLPAQDHELSFCLNLELNKPDAVDGRYDDQKNLIEKMLTKKEYFPF